MTVKMDRKAVIYCRVSSAAQTKRGDGLGSQETRCMEYARFREYQVVATFKDDSSGSLVDRPGMKAMLAFLKKQRNDQLIVVVDDISRIARSVSTHIKLVNSDLKLIQFSIEQRFKTDTRPLLCHALPAHAGSSFSRFGLIIPAAH